MWGENFVFFMLVPLLIAGITAIMLVLCVLIKPFIKIGKFNIGLYWIICLLGAVAILISGSVSLSTVVQGLTQNTAVNPLKILVLFISMTVISLFLGDSGFFGLVADKIFQKTKNGGIKLFLLLYAAVSILTVFSSNDIIILTFTPPICLFCKKAKVSPIPYLFAEFVGANTWSMALIIGNPTNVYIAGAYGITFAEYLKVMLIPTVIGGLTSLLVLLLLFRKQLFNKPNEVRANCSIIGNPHLSPSTYKIDKTIMIASLLSLFAVIVLLALSNLTGIEMWLVCLIFALSLIVFSLIYYIVKDKSLHHTLKIVGGAPFELIPFVLSMFVIVLALSECGFTGMLSNLFVSGGNLDGVKFGSLTAVCSNLLNNIPTSVLFEKIVSQNSLGAIYGSIIGTNIGAFITPVGALAGIMWTKILKTFDVKFSFAKFILYGVIVAIPTLLATTFALFITL